MRSKRQVMHSLNTTRISRRDKISRACGQEAQPHPERRRKGQVMSLSRQEGDITRKNGPSSHNQSSGIVTPSFILRLSILASSATGALPALRRTPRPRTSALVPRAALCHFLVFHSCPAFFPSLCPHITVATRLVCRRSERDGTRVRMNLDVGRSAKLGKVRCRHNVVACCKADFFS